MEKIIKIEELPEIDDYVYDLEIDNTHNFLANDIVVHNTDGIAVKKENGEKADFKQLEKTINEKLPIWMRKYTNNEEVVKNHKIIIEFETLFKRIIFTQAKKKYMGLISMGKGRVLEKPKFYGKGNELIRKDTPAGMKEELRKIVMDILESEETFEHTFVEMIKIKVEEIKKSLKSWTKDDLIIYKEINRDFDDYKVMPMHVRGALNSNKYLNTEFSRQNYKGGYIFVKSHKYPDIDVFFINESTKLTEDFVIDYDKYFEKYILNKIDLIFGKSIYNEVIRKDNNLSKWFC